MNMLRAHWPKLAAVVAVLVLVSVVRAWAGAIGEANAHEAMADREAARADSLSNLNGVLADSVAALDSAYSVSRDEWEAERAQNRAQIASARRAASEAVDALRPRLDSVGAALLAEYEAQVEIEREESARIVTSLEAEIASLHEVVRARDALVASLHAEIDIRADENTELRAANDALRRAVAPSFVTRIFDSWETHALVAGVGFAAGLAAR